MLNFIKANKLIIIISLFPFILYGKIILNDYNLDDDFVIENNKQVQQGIKGIPEIFKTRYTNRKGLNYEYRPITKSYFAVLYSIFGENTYVFHFFSIVLLSILALLIFKLFKLLFSDIKEEIIFFAILLFIAYPANTEVVASLKNNEQIFSAIFSVLSFIFLLKYIENNKITNLFISSISIFVATISKLDAILFIPIIIAGLIYFKKISVKKILIMLASILIMYSLFKYLKSSLPATERITTNIENPLYLNNDFVTKMATSFSIMISYLGKILNPFYLKFYYGYKEFQLHIFSDTIVWSSIIVMICLLGLVIYLFKKNKILSFTILVLLINVLAYSNIARPLAGVFADRFLFVSSIFYSLILSYSILRYIKRKYFAYVLLILIILSYSFSTINRNKEWENRETLFSADIDKLYETSAKANEMYASMLMNELSKNKSKKYNLKNLKLAEKHFEKCIEIYPNRFASLNNLGLINFMYYKNNKKALNYFQKANKINPDTNDIKVYYNIGLIHQLSKNYKKAVKTYNLILSKDSSITNVYYNLADIYFDIKDFDKAIQNNLLAAKNSPKSDKPYINIGKIYFTQKDTTMSIEYLKKAYDLNPNNELTKRVLKEYNLIP